MRQVWGRCIGNEIFQPRRTQDVFRWFENFTTEIRNETQVRRDLCRQPCFSEPCLQELPPSHPVFTQTLRGLSRSKQQKISLFRASKCPLNSDLDRVHAASTPKADFPQEARLLKQLSLTTTTFLLGIACLASKRTALSRRFAATSIESKKGLSAISVVG